jgi:hypothetical protein
MKKWIALFFVVLLALGGYVAAGPYLTVRAIRAAVVADDAAALSREVDFPALRSSLKAQLADRLVHAAGADVQASPFGAIGLSIAGSVVGGAVDAMVTPLGIGALMEGHRTWKYVRPGDPGADAQAPSVEPLHDARYRYESLSRFTATVAARDGDPVVFVISRKGLRWRLSDIRLPH